MFSDAVETANVARDHRRFLARSAYTSKKRLIGVESEQLLQVDYAAPALKEKQAAPSRVSRYLCYLVSVLVAIGVGIGIAVAVIGRAHV